ncbi:BAH_G0012310.mRNA.1.CDS.1 [Saccharomyces cerevisiae]|nr:SX2_G0047500.mRNA.1.CDS.1 [Saccharomyces cerevisiae]CAI4366812.1 BAH_G0012310.mRNA.1.CDS.1 [Saccharomyces cerevisiae]CAI4367020.1 BAG_1a_G0012450.mRNA.1.CDS.1 [Saccharomyces cerevisiae]CAI7082321.1 BAH_G0012310.mRNA.1.CDS.1 [Saccharomyces cerevisiae]CAI7082853.1 BAG_1a_G0012450.mRNA.1.CDS.1 [Saccharomyces cerevisiae]
MRIQSLFVLFNVAIIAWSYPYEPLRVLQVGENEVMEVPESEKLNLRRRGVKFFDVTKHTSFLPFFNKEEEPTVPTYNYPPEISNKEVVDGLIKNIDKGSMHKNLAKFTSFYTRYYKSDHGFESAEWLAATIANITKDIPQDTLTIEHFDHKEWKQYSIIVRVTGSTTPEDIIVIGSHQDSINLLLPSIMAAPGADDNGSGTVTNMEALRIYTENFLKRGFRPNNTVEFHFYSAEEGGLLGSLDVFTAYAKQKKHVRAMLQQDMTGYVSDPEDEHVGIVTDYTTPALTDFIKLIINSYLSIPYRDTQCGYACSDHGSATRNGFPGSFVIESEFKKTNKYIHSTMDTLDRLSLAHMAEHTKIVLGVIIELGSWSAW